MRATVDGGHRHKPLGLRAVATPALSPLPSLLTRLTGRVTRTAAAGGAARSVAGRAEASPPRPHSLESRGGW